MPGHATRAWHSVRVSRVHASVEVPGRIAEAEALFHDTSRWPAFVDGLHHVQRKDPGWPKEPGAKLRWTTAADGRGLVAEEVLRFEARRCLAVRVEDEQLRGTQTVWFEARGDRTRVTLELEYELKGESPVQALTDLLFIRRRQRESLQRTLTRFARELRSDRELVA
jgi:uncharacterized membrane protein